MYIVARQSFKYHNAIECASSENTGVADALVLRNCQLSVDAWAKLQRVSVISQPNDRQSDTGTSETHAGLHQHCN